nr:hypothetical protein BaRGS_012154 [Batillaria attramentaria]
MDSSEADSDVSDLDTNPFAKRVLRSPKLIPKSNSQDPEHPSTLSSSTSPSSDSPVKRRVPENWSKEAFEDPAPPSSPSKKLCDTRFDPSGHVTDTNFTSASTADSAFGSMSGKTRSSEESEGRDVNSQRSGGKCSAPVPLRMGLVGRRTTGSDGGNRSNDLQDGTKRTSAPPFLVQGSGRLNARSGNFDVRTSPGDARKKPLSARSSWSPSGSQGKSEDGGVTEVKVELHRQPEEKLGMIMGLEEEQQKSAGSNPTNIVVVKSVTPGGAASRAKVTTGGTEGQGQGLKVGDRIVEIDGRNISSLSDDECLNLLQDMPLDCVLEASLFIVAHELSRAGNTSSRCSR